MTYTAAKLRALRKQHGCTQQELAKGIGVSTSAISMYENGLREPDFDTLQKLADFLGVATNAFLPGPGEGASPPLPDNLRPMPQLVKKPRLGPMSCPQPTAEEDTPTDPVPQWLDCDFTLLWKGDSMINARIFDGDVVYIRAQSQVEHGEIAALSIGGEATLKRVLYYPDKLVLEAANPLYDPLVYRDEEKNGVQILGKVIGFTHILP